MFSQVFGKLDTLIFITIYI